MIPTESELGFRSSIPAFLEDKQNLGVQYSLGPYITSFEALIYLVFGLLVI